MQAGGGRRISKTRILVVTWEPGLSRPLSPMSTGGSSVEQITSHINPDIPMCLEETALPPDSPSYPPPLHPQRAAISGALQAEVGVGHGWRWPFQSPGRGGERLLQTFLYGKADKCPDFMTYRARWVLKTNFHLFFRFELLEILSFDSVRRRMSVIVKSDTGRNLFFFVVLNYTLCLCFILMLRFFRSFKDLTVFFLK